MLRSKLLRPVPRCWDATEGTQTWLAALRLWRTSSPHLFWPKPRGAGWALLPGPPASPAPPGHSPRHRGARLSAAPGESQAAPPSQLPVRQAPSPLGAILRTGAGGGSGRWRRLWFGTGSVYRSRPPSLIPRPKLSRG